MLNELIAIRNKNQPHSDSNLDPLQYDYAFWTDLEKIAKKNREKSLKLVKDASKEPEKPGVILRGKVYQTELKASEPVRSFDKEVFIDLILERFPKVPRHTLRELATEAVVEGNPRRTYTVSIIGEKDE